MKAREYEAWRRAKSAGRVRRHGRSQWSECSNSAAMGCERFTMCLLLALPSRGPGRHAAPDGVGSIVDFALAVRAGVDEWCPRATRDQNHEPFEASASAHRSYRVGQLAWRSQHDSTATPHGVLDPEHVVFPQLTVWGGHRSPPRHAAPSIPLQIVFPHTSRCTSEAHGQQQARRCRARCGFPAW